jgi:hypothetical protein
LLLDDATCAAVQVYNGETRYGDALRAEHVKRLLTDAEARLGALELVAMRGMMHGLAYSQLEQIVGQHVTRS